MSGTFPKWLDEQPSGFLRESIRVGGRFYQGETMGVFMIAPCEGPDYRGWFLNNRERHQMGYAPLGENIRGHVILLDTAKPKHLLPRDWFFLDIWGARKMIHVLCYRLARERLNRPQRSPGGKALSSEDAAKALAAGHVPLHLLQQHKARVLWLAAQHGALMGSGHDLCVAYLSMNHATMRATSDALAALPPCEQFVSMAGRTTLWPVPKRDPLAGAP